MTQGEVPERLEDHRAGLTGAQHVALADEDHPVAQVGDRNHVTFLPNYYTNS
jgi:hypothetical protein